MISENLINWFLETCKETTASGNMYKVWLHLVRSCLKLGKVEVRHSDRFFADECHLSRNTLKEAIHGLVKAKIIEVQEVNNTGKLYKLLGFSKEDVKRMYMPNLEAGNIDTSTTFGGANIDTSTTFGGANIDTSTIFGGANIDTSTIFGGSNSDGEGSTVDPPRIGVGQISCQPGSKVLPKDGSKIDPNYINININNSFYFYIGKNELLNSNPLWRATWGNEKFKKIALNMHFRDEIDLAASLIQFAVRNQTRAYPGPADIENHFWNWNATQNEHTVNIYKDQLQKSIRANLNKAWAEVIKTIVGEHPELDPSLKEITVLDLNNRTLTIKTNPKTAELIESEQYLQTFKKAFHEKFGKIKMEYQLSATH